jgi:hypothetical protein
MKRALISSRPSANRHRPGFDHLEDRRLLASGLVSTSLPFAPLFAQLGPPRPMVLNWLADNVPLAPPIFEALDPESAPVSAPGTGPWDGSPLGLPAGGFDFVLNLPPGRHDALDLASAIDPAAGSTLVQGRMEPGSRMDLFKVPANVGEFRVQLTALDPDSREADQLFLIDDQGRVMQSWALPELMNRLTIDLRMTGPGPGRWVYLGVGPGTGRIARSSEAYTLAFLPIAGSSVPGGTTDTPESNGSPPPGPVASATIEFVSSSRASIGQGVSVSASSFVTTSTGPGVASSAPAQAFAARSAIGPRLVPVIAGPPPVRLASPFGGLLAASDDLTTSERQSDAGTLVELGLLPLDVLPAATDPTLTVAPGPDFRLIDGPGGIPLLAVAQARVMGSVAADASPTNVGTMESVVAAGAGVGLADLRGDERVASPSLRSRIVPVGLSLVAMVVATLILPDVIEGPTTRRPSRSRSSRSLGGWLRSSLWPRLARGHSRLRPCAR